MAIASDRAVAQPSQRRSRRRGQAGVPTPRVLLVVVLGAFGLVMLFPLIWVLTTAFSAQGQLASGSLLPKTLSLFNFRYLLNSSTTQDPIVRWLVNSIGVSAVAAVIVAIIDSSAAFALSRLRFRGSKVMFYLFTSSLMVPFIALLLPLYLELRSMHLLNTYGALVLPYTSNAFGVFLLYQFFRGIPNELQEAAVSDGASRFQVWWKVFIPLSLSIMVTLALLTFMNVYNDFFWPLIATSSPNMRTITVGIEIVTVGQFATNYTALMALTVFSVIPMIIVFIFAQRRLVEGIALSGLN